MTVPTADARPATAEPVWFEPADCRLADFRAVVERDTDPHEHPYAERVERGVPVYGERMRRDQRAHRREIQAELARALSAGPGIVAFAGAFTAAVDYHLGFMSAEQAGRYPARVHRLSPLLTLQGAVAHVDMPVETGPTLYLPHSHKYPAGYLAFHQPEFTAYVDTHVVQLPLRKGDAVFFNPALFHGAGSNHTADVRRMANLLQISSGFGRAMETVDRTAMCVALYDTLARRRAQGADEAALRAVVAASAEGYAFPTNLDRDQPIGGLAPPTQAELLWRALAEGWDGDRVAAALREQAQRRGTG